MADISRLRAELSIQRRKIRGGTKVLKYLRVVHNIRLNVDPSTWEPIGGPLAVVLAVVAPQGMEGVPHQDPAQCQGPPALQEDPSTPAPPLQPVPVMP